MKSHGSYKRLFKLFIISLHIRYTTKENHTGLGLDNVLQLVEKSENFTLEINQSNNTIEFDFMMEGM